MKQRIPIFDDFLNESYISSFNILKDMGYHKFPKIVSEDAFEKFNGMQLWSFLSSDFGSPKKFVKQFMSGDFHTSISTLRTSDFGMNFFNNLKTVEFSKGEYDRNSIIMTIKLPTDYKLIDDTTLRNSVTDDDNMISYIVKNKIDGVIDKRMDHVMVLNRSKVIISKNPICQ